MHFKGLSLVCEIGGKSLGSIFFLFKKKKEYFYSGRMHKADQKEQQRHL